MPTITLEDTHTTLAELIEQLPAGGEVAILRDGKPVATLKATASPDPPPTGWQRPGPGLLKGMLTIVSEDDDHLKDFEEYLP